MDKKVFLLDKERYNEETAKSLSEKDLEKWVADEDYNENYTIIKIDANGYDDVESAIVNELPFNDIDDYYIRSFGF